MAKERQHDALQTIFSFFLGLMVVAFVGVGVNTFYKDPSQPIEDKLQALYTRQGAVVEKPVPTGGVVSPADQAAAEKVQKEINALQKQQREIQGVWQRNTSIVLILFATLVMAVSLIRSDQLKVISNGLLLGGLFTMIYGSGWTIASGDSIARFGVITFALAVTLGLGYLKFVRGRQEDAEGDAPATPAA